MDCISSGSLLWQLTLKPIEFNPISTGIFFDAYVPGDPPLKMAFLLQKCANFCPEMKFGNILARF